MAILVQTMEEQGMVEQWRADRRLWLNAEKDAVVEDGDPEAAFLYVTEGQLVPRPEAEELGAVEPEPAKKADKPADKQADKPADKSAHPAEKK